METEVLAIDVDVEETSCCIIVVGSVVSGFRFYGPFSSSDEAVNWVNDTSLSDEPWSVAFVKEPFH